LDIEESILEYFELEDGEQFCIQTRNEFSDEITSQILLERNLAIWLAKEILQTLGDN
jgi:hypothetical protein